MGFSNGQVNYDNSNADALAGSDIIGSRVLAGDDATEIGSQNIASDDWLNVAAALHAGDGTAITQTGGALDTAVTNTVTIQATDLDIRDLNSATDSVSAVQSGVWNIGTVASITADVNIADGGNSITVDAADLDIRDLTAASDSVASWLSDGAGTALTSTTVGSDQALDVNIVAGDDDDLANTAIESTAKAVTTTTGALLAAPLAARKYIFVQNQKSGPIWVGKSGVTNANGIRMGNYDLIEMRLGPSVALHAVGQAASSDVRIMELS